MIKKKQPNSDNIYDVINSLVDIARGFYIILLIWGNKLNIHLIVSFDLFEIYILECKNWDFFLLIF
jgi:hypothetical protein